MSTEELVTNTQLSPTTRALLLAVFDGDFRTVPHLYWMANLFWCDEALGWLVRNNLTGKKFVDWLKFDHDGSLISAASHIRMKLNRDLYRKPIIVGKDIR